MGDAEKVESTTVGRGNGECDGGIDTWITEKIGNGERLADGTTECDAGMDTWTAVNVVIEG